MRRRWAGYDIRTIQELSGHHDVTTTMMHAPVPNRGPAGVRSPMDALVPSGRFVDPDKKLK